MNNIKTARAAKAMIYLESGWENHFRRAAWGGGVGVVKVETKGRGCSGATVGRWFSGTLLKSSVNETTPFSSIYL